MKLKRFSLRFNLDREDDRRAWEALHRMDARSINREIIARINAKEQTAACNIKCERTNTTSNDGYAFYRIYFFTINRAKTQ